MTMRHLEIFLAVVESGSMRKAAEMLFISQPTISGAIREMEQAYDVRLFERLNQRLHITPEGRQLAIYARQILSLFREMEYTLQHCSTHAILRIGATLTVGTCVLPEILYRLQAKTEIPTSVQVKNTRAVAEDLLSGVLDIGFVEGAINHPDLVTLPVMQDYLVAVAATPAPPMTLAQFCNTYPLLLRESGSGTRDLLEQQMREKGIVCQPSWVCSNTQTLLCAAEKGLGATVISRLLAAEALAEGRLHEIVLQDCCMTRAFRLVWHKDKFQGDGFLTFCHICKEFGAPCNPQSNPE